MLVAIVALAVTACRPGWPPPGGDGHHEPPGRPDRLALVGTDEVDPIYGQGIAATDEGWILSGVNVLSRTAPTPTTVTQLLTPVIPPDLAAQGFDHVGDPDVVDGVLYVPFEQPDYTVGRQLMARFDAATLTFLDATPVAQHHNSFVAVDRGARIAYSTDQFDDDAILRYDLRHDWRPLPPIHLDRRLTHIQGGAVGGGAFWVSTDDDHDGVYRVDLHSGAVTDLGGTGHGAGEGEGIAYIHTDDGAFLHTVTVDAFIVPVYIDHWRLTH